MEGWEEPALDVWYSSSSTVPAPTLRVRCCARWAMRCRRCCAMRDASDSVGLGVGKRIDAPVPGCLPSTHDAPGASKTGPLRGSRRSFGGERVIMWRAAACWRTRKPLIASSSVAERASHSSELVHVDALESADCSDVSVDCERPETPSSPSSPSSPSLMMLMPLASSEECISGMLPPLLQLLLSALPIEVCATGMACCSLALHADPPEAPEGASVP